MSWRLSFGSQLFDQLVCIVDRRVHGVRRSVELPQARQGVPSNPVSGWSVSARKKGGGPPAIPRIPSAFLRTPPLCMPAAWPESIAQVQPREVPQSLRAGVPEAVSVPNQGSRQNEPPQVLPPTKEWSSQQCFRQNRPPLRCTAEHRATAADPSHARSAVQRYLSQTGFGTGADAPEVAIVEPFRQRVPICSGPGSGAPGPVRAPGRSAALNRTAEVGTVRSYCKVRSCRTAARKFWVMTKSVRPC